MANKKVDKWLVGTIIAGVSGMGLAIVDIISLAKLRKQNKILIEQNDLLKDTVNALMAKNEES